MAKGKKISPRHLAREWAVQFMFQLDIREAEFTEQDLKLFWNQLTLGASAKKQRDFKIGQPFADELIQGILEHQVGIDEKLEQYSSNWTLKRMSVVDRNILRVGAYEILIMETPAEVVISEALEIAKGFSDIESPSFINAVLDQINKNK